MYDAFIMHLTHKACRHLERLGNLLIAGLTRVEILPTYLVHRTKSRQSLGDHGAAKFWTKLKHPLSDGFQGVETPQLCLLDPFYFQYSALGSPETLDGEGFLWIISLGKKDVMSTVL